MSRLTGERHSAVRDDSPEGPALATATMKSGEEISPGLDTRGGFREIFAIPAYRRLLFAQLGAQLGETIALVAMPVLVYDLTGSAELLGLIFVLQLLPRVLLAPISGMLADRMDRRRIILAADLARAGLVVLLPFTNETWQIALVAVLVAVGNAVVRPAELAAVPMVVPPAQLSQALSLSHLAFGIVRVVGPALAAGVISLTGPRPAFGVQACCFLIAAAIVFGLDLPPVARARPSGDFVTAIRQEIGDGFRVVRHNPIVRGITAVESLWQLVFAALVVSVLIYVEETLRLGDAAAAIYSLLTASFAAGTVVGSLAARPVERRIGRPWLLGLGYMAPLMFIPAGLTPPLPVLFLCLFILGFTDALAVIAMQTYLAEAVPDALRGRVYAAWLGVVTLAGAGAFGLVGWLTPRLGPPATLALVGVVVGIGGPLLLLATGALAAMRAELTPVTGPETAEPVIGGNG